MEEKRNGVQDLEKLINQGMMENKGVQEISEGLMNWRSQESQRGKGCEEGREVGLWKYVGVLLNLEFWKFEKGAEQEHGTYSRLFWNILELPSCFGMRK